MKSKAQNKWITLLMKLMQKAGQEILRTLPPWRNCTEEECEYFFSRYLDCSLESAEFADAVVDYRRPKLDD